jgi:hypothetical protein
MSTPKQESMSLPALLGAGAVLVVVTVAIALLAPVFFRTRAADLRAERGWTATPEETRQLRASQQDRIAHYAWIDKAKGVVALPIERAMELSVQDLNKPKPGKEGGR